VNELGGTAAARNQTGERAPSGTVETLATWIFAGILLCAGLVGFAAPLWPAKGAQRSWFMMPAILMGAVALRLAIDLPRDPTSHNLFPFEFILAGVLGLALSGVSQLLRKLRRPT
jgi:hypothetical protein